MGWIDSHAHLVSDGLYENFDEYMENCKNLDVERVLIICGSLKEVKRALKECDKYDNIDLAIGVHPTDVLKVDESEFNEMMTYLDHPRVVALGEIGLDYYWDDSFKDIQKKYFKKQLEISDEKHLPIIVHVRSSIDDVYNMLQEYDKDHKGVIHCFSETPEMALLLQKMGYYLGYGGIITFKNGDNVRENFKVTQKDRVLSETDSPFLAPVPMRGKRNQSAFVKYVGEYIGDMWEITPDKAQVILRDNYERLFKKNGI